MPGRLDVENVMVLPISSGNVRRLPHPRERSVLPRSRRFSCFREISEIALNLAVVHSLAIRRNLINQILKKDIWSFRLENLILLSGSTGRDIKRSVQVRITNATMTIWRQRR